MKRFIIIVALALLLIPAVSTAQTTRGIALLNAANASATDATASASSATTQNNTPGAWITAARTRHQLLTQARVNNGRTGEKPGTTDGITTNTGTSSSSSSLLDLVSQLASSATGSSSSLTSLLGGLTGTDTTSSAGTTGTSGTNYTLADLLAMAAGTTKAINSADSQDTASADSTKTATRQQSATDTSTTTRSFGDRFAESMATTVFTALSVGFQSSAFINLLKVRLEPLFTPQDSTTDGNDTNDSTSGGIEDQQTPDNDNSSGSGSIV